MTSLAKPNRVERFAPGTSVQIHSGKHAGKTGKAWRVFAGRVATEDAAMVELPGRDFTSVFLTNLEVAR